MTVSVTKLNRAAIVVLFVILLLVFAASAKGDIGWYAKWSGKPPITVTVAGIAALPADDQSLFEAAMADWSLSPSVNIVSGGGSVRLVVEASQCGGSQLCFKPKASNYRLHGGTLYIDPVVFTWPSRQWAYCHELGHALGLGEGYPVEQTGDYNSCMSGTGDHPSQMDYDELALMYPVD